MKEEQETQQEVVTATSSWRSDDIQVARTTEEVVELRRQATRRRLTFAVMGTLCAGTLYLLIWVPDMRSEAFAGILGMAGTAAGFYYGGQSA